VCVCVCVYIIVTQLNGTEDKDPGVKAVDM